jgi:hypothetical protein
MRMEKIDFYSYLGVLLLARELHRDQNEILFCAVLACCYSFFERLCLMISTAPQRQESLNKHVRAQK